MDTASQEIEQLLSDNESISSSESPPELWRKTKKIKALLREQLREKSGESGKIKESEESEESAEKEEIEESTISE